jgi:hypothetical protein
MRVCHFCGKSYNKAVHRRKTMSKYNPSAPYRQKANLQMVKIDGKKVKACTNCRRKLLTLPISGNISGNPSGCQK